MTPKVLPVELGYDAHGRLETVTHGPRVSTRAYRPDGYLDSVTDALVQTTDPNPWLRNKDLGFPLPAEPPASVPKP